MAAWTPTAASSTARAQPPEGPRPPDLGAGAYGQRPAPAAGPARVAAHRTEGQAAAARPGARPTPALAARAHLCPPSCLGARRVCLRCGRHGYRAPPLCRGRDGPRAPPHAAYQWHGASHDGVDPATAARSDTGCPRLPRAPARPRPHLPPAARPLHPPSGSQGAHNPTPVSASQGAVRAAERHVTAGGLRLAEPADRPPSVPAPARGG